MKQTFVKVFRVADANENKGGGAPATTTPPDGATVPAVKNATKGDDDEETSRMGFREEARGDVPENIVLPKEVQFACTIANISKPIEHPRGTYKLLQCVGLDGTLRNISINPTFLDLNNDVIVKGAEVNLTLQKNIKEVTQYKNLKGEWEFHESTRDTVAGAVPLTIAQKLAPYSGDPEMLKAMAVFYGSQK